MGVAPRDILDVAKGLVYQGEAVSDLKIKVWLEQFGGAKYQELALKLLRKLKAAGFFDDARVHQASRSLHRMIVSELVNSGRFGHLIKRGKATNVFVSHFGREGKSGADMLYRYRSANALPAQLTGRMEEALKFVSESASTMKSCAVIFVDDFVGTGGTCIEGLRSFEGLVSGLSSKPENLAVFVAAFAGFKGGLEAVRASAVLDCRVIPETELDSSDCAFSPDAGIFDSEEERLEAEKLCRSIGEHLEPKHPLGFGDCQALISFNHRCPNNTLPIFYKLGVEYHGREWLPLFPR